MLGALREDDSAPFCKYRLEGASNMSALRMSCVVACVVALGCGADERGSGPENTNGATNTDGNSAGAGADANGGPGAGGNQTSGQGSTDGGGTGGDTGGKGNDASRLPPLSAACNGKVRPGVSGELPKFTRATVTAQAGAAYLHPADLNGDGFPEFLLTSLSEGLDIASTPPLDFGGAYVLSREGGAPKGELGDYSVTKGFDKSAKIACPNASETFDVDGDGIKDWVIGAGFLLKGQSDSNIVWMKSDGKGAFGTPNQLPVPDRTCWYHIALGIDIDGDKDNDFITSCHVGDVMTAATGASRVEWFENDGKGGFKSHAIGAGGGSLLSLWDLDADGDQDVIAPQFFGPESMVWYEQTEKNGAKWVKHIVNNTTGRGFIVKFADMNGDGKVDMLYGNHNNEIAKDAAQKIMGLYWFDLPEAGKVRGLTNWDAYKHTIYEGFVVDGSDPAERAGAPGMINVGDIDGDCDMDVTASGDGDLGLYAFIQQADNKFDRVNLYVNASNANSGEQHLYDLDGDGDLDIMWAVFGPAGIRAITGLNSHVYAFLQD